MTSGEDELDQQTRTLQNLALAAKATEIPQQNQTTEETSIAMSAETPLVPDVSMGGNALHEASEGAELN